MSNFWENKKVLVTGGAGFIGSHLVEKLVNNGSKVTVLDNLENGRLENLDKVKNEFIVASGDCKSLEAAEKICQGQEIVMNLAAKIRGNEYNREHPATMLSENLIIETNMIEGAKRAGVDRFLFVSSAVVYPENCSIPTPEEEGFMGEPEYSNYGYGWAKRIGEVLGKLYKKEFGMKIAIVRPYNCYGPRDHFFPKPNHVVPSLIRRIIDGDNPVIVWGTGRQTRAFLYVEDLVDGMMLATEKYAVADPVNLGTEEEVSIRELVEKIMAICGKKIKVVFDTTKPDGSPRRNSDNKKAFEKIGFKAKVKLDSGLKETIRWYKEQKLQ